MIKLSKDKLLLVLKHEMTLLSDSDQLILQIYDIQKVNQKNVAKISLSDGKYYSPAYFLIKLSEDESSPKRFNVIKLLISNLKYNKEKNLFVIKHFDIYNDNVNYNIENPMKFSEDLHGDDFSDNAPRNIQQHNNKNSNSYMKSNNKPKVSSTNMQPHNSNLKNFRIDDNSLTFDNLTSFSNNIRIPIRVVFKSQMGVFHNKIKGTTSNFFYIIMCDKNGEELKLSLFGKEAETYYDLIKNFHTYLLDNVDSKPNSDFRVPHSIDYAIKFTSSSQIVEINDDQNFIPYFGSLKTLIDLKDIPEHLNSYISSLVKITEINTETKTNKGDKMRRVQVMSSSGYNCLINFFKDEVPKVESLKLNEIYLLKYFRVNEYKGILNLQSHFLSYIIDNQLILKEFNNEISTLSSIDIKDNIHKIIRIGNQNTGDYSGYNINNLSTISLIQKDINQISSFSSDKNIEFNKIYKLRGYFIFPNISNIDFIMYPACPKCKKKTLSKTETLYECSNNKCENGINGENFEPNWTYNLRMDFIDYTGKEVINIFGNSFDFIFNNQSAREIRQYSNEQMNEKIKSLSYDQQYVITVKVKNEYYNGNSKFKLSLIAVTLEDKIKYKDIGSKLLSEVETLLKEVKFN